ncbi:anti sigma factor antagonist [Treponema pallidum subsp. pallidum DAL-1]|uniref:Anti-sigma factor antagonist n=1 Tax=Treponema pallidum (strain Nichols) TaxID=243276 RepID=O83261_TREPA|nr:STAS domain-containing protein [Treponema pallidum]AAC65221.1 anti-sigma F factor antagonist, putative [Treponema pallidum subsp. pallidum str. Nichols]ADD72371.1 anti-anti-sigma factor [Treponema pallidum subsp. pallidum str. Chicago]AEZ60556.1 anti sigma factor antagonist [Treponema pallidum subsp. pallidum DAL-1]AGN75445.1 anti sigma factor antagonist [Treponema pallidum subsp. pallidum str. Nichols]ANI43216.1 anti-sigma F factor antagonist [Treponema pallidum subsp. pallidum]
MGTVVPGFDDEKDESLKMNLQKIDDLEGGVVVFLNGYIDTYNSSFFQKRIAKVIDAGYTRIVFNCASLNYVSSTGIGSFTAFLKTVKPKGGDIVLLDIQPRVYEVFQLLGFSQFFNIRDSIADAVSLFRNKVSPLKVDTFPKVFSCPICSKKLKATKQGRFRCSECKTILALDASAHVSLG